MLFLAHGRELQRYLSRWLRDADTAADLTQETFLRFVETGPAAVLQDRSYLFQTARNLAIDHQRQADRRRTDLTDPDVIGTLAADQPSPEAVVAARRELQRLDALLDGLPRRTREIFLLNKVEGLSYTEVASALGISESSVQKHLAKALQRIMPQFPRP
ncbi:RNA polymerase subunit sigma-70 [Zavarzinia compransoris]|uniref:RNA polymerase subunit sigma-70 n=2 Tax=Zavarzinia compransoris TaxID=1264899 RepID=A0A317E976_9PROT|nr:RNA polymerase subunit sigma-70 [Zavarzinia compransoris]